LGVKEDRGASSNTWVVESNPSNPLGLVAHTWCCEGQGWFDFKARGGMAGDGSGGGGRWRR